MTKMTEAETEQALHIWEEFRRQNDLSERKGQAVGIEPISGRIWFGETARDIRGQLDAEGIDRPFLCARVGASAYLVKKGRPC